MNKYLGAIELAAGEILSSSLRDYFRDLTFKVYKPSGEMEEVCAYKRGAQGKVYLPRQCGYAGGYASSIGKKWTDTLRTPELRTYQEPVIQQVVQKLRADRDTVLSAYTGSGKTIMSLEVARTLGKAPLILVDREILMEVWKKTLTEFYGYHYHDIGIVQGKKCVFKNKVATIAMLQTIVGVGREWSTEFLTHYGMVIFDEVHKTAAPVMSEALMMFPAMYRLGVSATPLRKDALAGVLKANLGGVGVKLEKEHKKSVVRVVNYKFNAYSDYANRSKMTGRYVNEVAADMRRNMLLCDILQRLYNQGRDILALSERTDHIHVLKCMLVQMGIPEDKIGLVTRQKKYWKDDEIKIRRPGKKELEDEMTKKIILGTYHILDTGVDIPRLSAGVELTPRSAVAQAQGRILRKQKGKKIPVWVTICDVNSYRSVYQLSQRIHDYVYKSNAELKLWQLDKGVKKLNEKLFQVWVDGEAKRLRILVEKNAIRRVG